MKLNLDCYVYRSLAGNKDFIVTPSKTLGLLLKGLDRGNVKEAIAEDLRDAGIASWADIIEVED